MKMEACPFCLKYKEFCESGPYYEAKPEKTRELDLEKCAKELSVIGKVESKNRFFVCLKIGECEAVLYRKGKLVIKGRVEKWEAEKLAQKIYLAVGIR